MTTERDAMHRLKNKSAAEADSQRGTTAYHAHVDSTRRADEPSLAEAIGERGEECLRLMEAIRLTAPEYLDDILTANTERGDTAGGVSDVAAAEPPMSIGRFRILRPLGRGGHAVVFLAEDPLLRRQVALKVPRPETLMTESLRRRFVREAEAAAALNHPNIVPIYETGTVGPVCYIAAAYCPGNSLSDWMRTSGGPVAAGSAAEIVTVLADAVQHAHARGILHRDIKPANVLLDESPESEPPEQGSTTERPSTAATRPLDFARLLRLADFGLARVGDVATADSLASDVLGTPSYMAPEQATGQADLVTTATDVYGLGATLYHLLAGRPPFQGANQVQTILAVREQDPRPPSDHAAGIPRDLDAICLKCLEKDPARRYATAAELKDDLQRHLEHKPVRARPVGRTVRVARWCRRRPALTAMSGLVLLSVVVGSGNVVWQWSRAERHLATSQLERQHAIDNLHSARQAVDELLTEVALELKDTPQLQALRRNLLLKAARINEQLLQNDQGGEEFQLESIRAWRRAAEIFAELGDADQRGRAIQKGIELATHSAAQDAEADFAALYCDRGELRQAEQEYAKALEDYRQAMQLWHRVLTPNVDLRYHAEAAETIGQMGGTMVKLGDYTQADVYFQQAVDRLRELTLADSDDCTVSQVLARAERSLGKHYQSTGRFQEALAEYEGAADQLARLIESQPLSTRFQQQQAELRVDVAYLLVRLKRFSDADAAFQSAASSLQHLADDFPLSPSIKIWLAKCLTGQALVAHRFDQVEVSAAMQDEATAILTDLVDRHDTADIQRELSNAYGQLAKLRRLCGDFPGAEQAAARAVATAEEIVSTQSPTCSDRKILAQALFNLACLQFGQEDSVAAMDSCRQAAAERQLVLALNPTDYTNRTQLVKVFAILASAEIKLGYLREAADRLASMTELAPKYSFARTVVAIAWLEMASRLEQERPEGQKQPLSDDLTVEGCRRKAIEELNLAVQLENFDLPSLTRMESIADLLRRPECRAQLADVYQAIDLSTLPPPLESPAAAESVE